MVNVEDFILGNEALHKRLCLTTKILGELVMRAPRSVRIAQLESLTGHPAREVEKICRGLFRAKFLRLDPISRSAWALACEPSLLTLEDVFRFVLADLSPRNKPEAGLEAADAVHHDVDLLLMQATIGINQTIFQHLRRFSLDRLKASASGMFPPPKNPLGSVSRVW